MARVIGVVSGKGGVGKTTLVSNLGSVLALHYKKDVVIVDCNITTSHLGLYFGMYYYPVSINHVIKGEAKVTDAMYDYHINGLRIIPASLSYKDISGTDMAKIKNVVKELFDKTDIIILDAAPGLGREAMGTLQAADEILFVATPFAPAVMDLIKCHQIAKNMESKPLGIVLNMVGGERYELTTEEVEKLVELPVISRVPADEEVLKSLAMKMPVVIYNSRAKSTKEFISLAGRLVGEKYRPPGILRSLFGRFGKRPAAPAKVKSE
jgi:cell division ATPase MinD